MKLSEKLKNISNPEIIPMRSGKDKKLSDFWNNFIAPLLPAPDIVKRWYDLLLKYTQDKDIVFVIRYFGSVSNKNDYHMLRRGFYNTTDNGYSFFYTDNFFAAYFAKMALDGYIPDYEEFKQMMISREFPARFGPHDSKYENVKAAYDITGKKGPDPKINSRGYKIAHIFDTGKNFYVNDNFLNIEEICQKYCPRGNYDDWKTKNDEYGEYYVRHLGKMKDEARQFFAAHFLRLTCPLNYILTPKQGLHFTSVSKDIAEYNNFQRYAMKKLYEIYGDTYKDFISHILTDINIDNLDVTDEDIDIEYGLELKRTPTVETTNNVSTIKQTNKNTSRAPRASKQIFIKKCSDAGYTTLKSVRVATLNSVRPVYWLNPTEEDFANGFSLLCNDDIKKEIHILNIQKNDVDITKLKRRDHMKFNVEIKYNDPTFTDRRSGIKFEKYFVGTIPNND